MGLALVHVPSVVVLLPVLTQGGRSLLTSGRDLLSGMVVRDSQSGSYHQPLTVDVQHLTYGMQLGQVSIHISQMWIHLTRCTVGGVAITDVPPALGDTRDRSYRLPNPLCEVGSDGMIVVPCHCGSRCA